MILFILTFLMLTNIVGYYYRKKIWARILMITQLLTMAGMVIALGI
jgi:hypothetical protein